MTIKDYLNGFTEKDDRIGALSFFASYAFFFVALYVSIQLSHTWYLAAPFCVITAFAGVRLYVLQHDCGHHSLFSKRWVNTAAGYALSLVTLTPYYAGKVNHDIHHAYLGNLDHRETTEIHTMTLREWNEAPWHTRLWYRLYRNPLIMLPVGGILTFFIVYRWPKNTRKIGVAGVLAHNAMLAAFLYALWLGFGWAGPLTYAATAVISSLIGVFLVFLQHNFEDTYWDRKPDLDFRRAALQGSSCLDLGHLWDIGTGNIAYHDIHHFNPRIPSYRLRKCHHNMPEEFALRRIKWPEALHSFTLKLWDEENERLVPFPKTPRARAIPAE